MFRSLPFFLCAMVVCLPLIGAPPEPVVRQILADLRVVITEKKGALSPQQWEREAGSVKSELEENLGWLTFTEQELADFEAGKTIVTDADLANAVREIEAAVDKALLPSLVVYYESKRSTGTLTAPQKTLFSRLLAMLTQEIKQKQAAKQ